MSGGGAAETGRFASVFRSIQIIAYRWIWDNPPKGTDIRYFRWQYPRFEFGSADHDPPGLWVCRNYCLMRSGVWLPYPRFMLNGPGIHQEITICNRMQRNSRTLILPVGYLRANTG
jgi:hypothetical protein